MFCFFFEINWRNLTIIIIIIIINLVNLWRNHEVYYHVLFFFLK